MIFEVIVRSIDLAFLKCKFFLPKKYKDLPITDVVEIQEIVTRQPKSGFRLERALNWWSIKKPGMMIFLFWLDHLWLCYFVCKEFSYPIITASIYNIRGSMISFLFSIIITFTNYLRHWEIEPNTFPRIFVESLNLIIYTPDIRTFLYQWQ